ncbi:MAG: hypothetical protein BGO21_15085 [Dyadobacter sp. 50-39]|nr:MAG: hypothetical protein BGO21_15085 [Dyadobacter sp. 50-39]
MHEHAGHSQKNPFMAMMDTMMTKMEAAGGSISVETGFITQMIPHHEGAIAMANYQIKYGKSFVMIQLAKSILAEQTNELQKMKLWLVQAPEKSPAIDPTGFDKSMAQTMHLMMERMPDPTALTDTDHDFARIMIPHHQAAIDMAKAAISFSRDQQTSAFAKQIIASESIEVEQMSAFLNE